MDKNDITTLDSFEEVVGKGIEASRLERRIKIGSSSFVDVDSDTSASNRTCVYISSNDDFKGRFVFQNSYREGMLKVFQHLSLDKKIIVLSGDNDSEKKRLEMVLPKSSEMLFDQKPDDKLRFIKDLQSKGQKVMMVGDGLNDAGALAQSDVGVAISENINVFTPACDGILDAANFDKLDSFLKLSKKGVQIIKWSFLLSFVYNLIGLSFAVSGLLSPVIAAILMPLSSISIVVFTTLATQYHSKRLLER